MFQGSKMHDTTIETETRKTSRCRKNSRSAEEASSGGNSHGGSPLKKGPWTSAEDAILVEYVNKHGEGNWNAVQKHSGLSRCGKSCRLRWANHLRPDLKKGSFTPEEENRIIKLHAKMGNKWARMASELPGRTDNEIKNFWNTRTKRLQRAGLPIYPPDISVQVVYENQQGQDRGACRTGEKHHSDSLQPTEFDIPDVEFKNLELSKGFLNCPTAMIDIPTSSILQKGTSPSHGYSYMLPAVHPHKRLRETETPFIDSIGSASNVFSSFDQYEDDSYGKLASSFWESSPYDPDLNINDISPVDLLPCSHASINGTTTEPFSAAMKFELPSFQYSTPPVGSWASSSPLPSLESVDTLIQSPLSEPTQSNCPSPRNSGLLEAIVYESQSLKNSTNYSHQQLSEAHVTAGNMMESALPNVCDTKWENCGEPMSPLSQSAASAFVDYTPVSGSSSEERHSAETTRDESGGKKDVASQLDFLRPDAVLDSFFTFGQCTGRGKDQSVTMDMGLFCDDLSYEYEQVGIITDDSNQSCCAKASDWDNISAVCHFSKNR